MLALVLALPRFTHFLVLLLMLALMLASYV